jgi:hypothetical protein
MFSDFNGNLYLWLFWSAELIGNDENCIQGHFYFQNGAYKIGKISMFSDFNENWYLAFSGNEKLIGNDENCIQGHFYFQNGRRQNRQNINVLLLQWKLISRVILKRGIDWYWWKLHSWSFLRCHRFQNGCQQNRQIVNGLRF